MLHENNEYNVLLFVCSLFRAWTESGSKGSPQGKIIGRPLLWHILWWVCHF